MTLFYTCDTLPIMNGGATIRFLTGTSNMRVAISQLGVTDSMLSNSTIVDAACSSIIDIGLLQGEVKRNADALYRLQRDRDWQYYTSVHIDEDIIETQYYLDIARAVLDDGYYTNSLLDSFDEWEESVSYTLKRYANRFDHVQFDTLYWSTI